MSLLVEECHIPKELLLQVKRELVQFVKNVPKSQK